MRSTYGTLFFVTDHLQRIYYPLFNRLRAFFKRSILNFENLTNCCSVYVINNAALREGLKRKARSQEARLARTCNGKPGPQGHAQQTKHT